MRKLPVAEIRIRVAKLLDLMEQAEENGASPEQIVILGAFADGVAFALGEELEEDYFALAEKLARIKKKSKKVDWKII